MAIAWRPLTALAFIGCGVWTLAQILGGRRVRRNPRPAPRAARKRRRRTEYARTLAAIERDATACTRATACYEPRPDRRGRRRRCRETFKNKREALEALDEALDGMLTRYLEAADDGSEVLRDLGEQAEDRRGRRRRFRSWYETAAWAAPSSRRWRDFDPHRLEIISSALRDHLTHGGGAEPLPLVPPEQARRLWEADARARECVTEADDRRADARQRRKARRALPALADVPF
jgi:hypothetical protein